MAATRAKTQDIESRSQMRSATDGHRADAPGGEPRGDCRRDGPHNDESAHGVAMRAWSCPQVVAGPAPQPIGRNQPSEHACFRRLALEGVGWTTARTEVLLGESPHDPGARCAGFSALGRTHRSQHRGDLSGLGCVPGLSPGVAPDGDVAHSQPPRPHRDGTGGRAPGAPRSTHRAGATPVPRHPATWRPVKLARTQTVRSTTL